MRKSLCFATGEDPQKVSSSPFFKRLAIAIFSAAIALVAIIYSGFAMAQIIAFCAITGLVSGLANALFV